MSKQLIYICIGAVFLVMIASLLVVINIIDDDEPEYEVEYMPELNRESLELSETINEDNADETVESSAPKSLSKLQIDMCNAADDAGTCQTNLVELGIVMPEDCCEALGVCC